jgi:hypothetical protein
MPSNTWMMTVFSTVTVDARWEAQWHIENALNGFEKLGLRRTPTIWRYLDYDNALTKAKG